MEIQKLAASFVPVPSWFLKDKDDILDSSVCFLSFSQQFNNHS